MKIRAGFRVQIIAFITGVLLLLSSLFTTGAAITPVSAAENQKSIEETTVTDDLKDFDILKYPKNPLGDVQLINFMEYCYSDRAILKEHYQIYFYVYNPTEKPLRTEPVANSVLMASDYDAEGNPIDYTVNYLKFINNTDNHRFYKFKLTATKEMLEQAKWYAYAFGGVRRYDVSGVQVWFKGDDTPTDYSVSITYEWSGYAKGCGADEDAESTLACKADNLVTLDLPLYHYKDGKKIMNQTRYRTPSSSLGANHRWQIDTVYFSIDEDDLSDKTAKELGILQKIKAKWYEYQTKPIYVTSSSKLKAALDKYIGVDISGMTDGQKKDELKFGFGYLKQIRQTGEDSRAVDWAWGYGLMSYFYSDKFLDSSYYYNYRERNETQIDWLFQVDEPGKVRISQETLLEYIAGYAEKFGAVASDEYLTALGYNETLFTDTVAQHGDGKEVKRGENVLEFDTNGTFDLSSYDSTLSGWDRFRDWLYGVDSGGEWEINNMAPIEQVTKESLSALYSDEQISEKYKIDPVDVAEFRRWAKEETDNGKEVYLFRFAVTDYLHEQLHVEDYTDNGRPYDTTHPLSMVQEAVFLGFEILTLTYNNHGDMTVIPVVQSPINIFDPIDVELAKKPGLPLWAIIAIIVIVLLILILLCIFVKPFATLAVWLIKGAWWVVKHLLILLWWIISAPFRLIIWAIKRRKEKKEDDTEPPQGKNKNKTRRELRREKRAEKKARRELKREQREEEKERRALEREERSYREERKKNKKQKEQDHVRKQEKNSKKDVHEGRK